MISDLHLSLLGLGALLVGGVWGYNRWQERKFRREISAAFAGETPDPLLPAGPDDSDAAPAWAREPAGLSDASAIPTLEEALPATPPAPAVHERREPSVGADEEATSPPPIAPEAEPPVPVRAEEEPASLPPPVEPPPAAEAAAPLAAAPVVAPWPPAEWCDESIDALVRIEFIEPVGREDLALAHRAMRDQVRLPLRAYVQLASGGWQKLEDVLGGEFGCCCLALQLVDRHGPVTKAELDSLYHASQGLANLRRGQAAFPNIGAAAEQARALDEFCAQLDLQLALNVIDTGHGAFPGTKVRGLAEATGMQLMPNGEFQAFDEEGNFLFAMANMGEGFDSDTLRNLQTHGLTFLLDVPHVRNGGHAFERMLAAARQCATAFNGTLVNAQRAPVSDAMVDSIRKKIVEIHEQMQIAGIAAGGPRALRLFS